MMIRKSVVVTGLVMIASMAGALVGLASHQFNDVATDHVFHEDIAWLAESGITRGCNPPANDEFCPEDSVTRGQMAAFLHRLGESQVEETIAIDQFAFFPISVPDQYIDYDYQAAGFIGRVSDSTLGASVPIPNGAFITGFSATVCDSTNANDTTAALVRRPDPGSHREVLAEVTSTGDGCAVTTATSEIATPLVDTGNYSYAVEVHTTDYARSGWIRRVTVTYQRPLLP